MMTWFQEEIPFRSLGISLGEQNQIRSTTQPQILSENTLATFEANPILLDFQLLASKSNSATAAKL